MGTHMVRRILAVVTLAVAGLLALPALAMAATQPPYPAPPVTPATETWAPVATTTIDDPYAALASTGAGISIGTFVAIGAIVLVVGIALLVVGNRMRRSNSHS